MKAVLVGCGCISRNHLLSLNEIPDMEIVGLCDIKPERAEAARDNYAKNAKVFTDYITMLDETKPDSVHITVPHYLHCDFACEALKRNMNVFLEKPVCISEAEIQRLLEAEKASKGKICVCFQNRFNGSTLAAHKLVEEHGGALCGRGMVTWERDENYYVSSGWRGSKTTEGGGVLINQAIHELDLLLGFIGTPDTVIGTSANHHLKNVIEVEDSAELLITSTDGKKGYFSATTSFPFDAPNYLEIYCQDKHRVTLLGDQLLLDGKNVDYVEAPFEGFASAPGKACWGTGHKRLISMFYSALAEGKEMPVSVQSASYAVLVLLALYRSNDTPVKINA